MRGNDPKRKQKDRAMSENLSTYEWATIISESFHNGQRKQAVDQFRRGIAEHCTASALLADIAEIIGCDDALVIAAMVMDAS